MSHLRPAAFLMLTALLLALPACMATRGPSLPDLSSEHNQINQRSLRLERIRQVMSDDVAEFARLRVEFGEVEPGFYARPFPLDLFKHVAIECLNEPWDPNQLEVSDASQPDQPGQQADDELRLSCSPEFGDRLLVQLEEKAPMRRQEAIAKLESLDRLRRLRGTIRQRLGRVPAILRSSKSLLAARRADLRQMRASFARRRTEYSVDRWQQLEQRLAAFEQDLGALERQIERLEVVYPSWAPALDHSVSMLYMEVAKLSP